MGWILAAGVEAPHRNVFIPSLDGTFEWEIDLLYPEPPTAIEVSPWETHDDPVTYRKDLRKREELETMGYKVLVVTGPDDERAFLQALKRRLSAHTNSESVGEGGT